jgi:cytochrome c-type biogenesis protein
VTQVSGTVLDGSLLLAVPIAMLAGLVSFASPCVLPLVPGYLGYVTGLTGEDLERQDRSRMFLGVLLFVAGFTAVFVTAGWAAGALGDSLIRYDGQLSRVLGVLTIVLGLVFAGVFSRLVPATTSSWRLSVKPAAGLIGAPLLGIVFGLGWTPCIGPTLGAIILLAGDFGDPARGALLATFYCIGLGAPFLVAALAYRRAMSAFGVLRRHRVAIARFGGGMLVLIGVLLVTGVWAQLVIQAQSLAADFAPAL